MQHSLVPRPRTGNEANTHIHAPTSDNYQDENVLSRTSSGEREQEVRNEAGARLAVGTSFCPIIAIGNITIFQSLASI